VTTLLPLEPALLPVHPGRALPRFGPVTTLLPLEPALLPAHPGRALPRFQ
jgi:hypothetical protein